MQPIETKGNMKSIEMACDNSMQIKVVMKKQTKKDKIQNVNVI